MTSRMTCQRENWQGRKRKSSSIEASHNKHRPHIKVVKYAKRKNWLHSSWLRRCETVDNGVCLDKNVSMIVHQCQLTR